MLGEPLPCHLSSEKKSPLLRIAKIGSATYNLPFKFLIDNTFKTPFAFDIDMTVPESHVKSTAELNQETLVYS